MYPIEGVPRTSAKYRLPPLAGDPRPLIDCGRTTVSSAIRRYRSPSAIICRGTSGCTIKLSRPFCSLYSSRSRYARSQSIRGRLVGGMDCSAPEWAPTPARPVGSLSKAWTFKDISTRTVTFWSGYRRISSSVAKSRSSGILGITNPFCSKLSLGRMNSGSSRYASISTPSRSK